MEAVASSEIKGDVTVLRERVEGLQPALATVGVRPGRCREAERQKFQDEAASKAVRPLTAYGTQVCKA